MELVFSLQDLQAEIRPLENDFQTRLHHINEIIGRGAVGDSAGGAEATSNPEATSKPRPGTQPLPRVRTSNVDGLT
jgi:hypothetical protein